MPFDTRKFALPAIAALLLTACLEDRSTAPEEKADGAAEAPVVNNTEPGKPNYEPDRRAPAVTTLAQPGSPKYIERYAPPPERPAGLAKSADINSRDVGVIVNTEAAWNACPVGNRVIIKTDDEDVIAGISQYNQSIVGTHMEYDSDNIYDPVQDKTIGYGWVPYSLKDGNTYGSSDDADGRNNSILKFCKVPGNTLKPLKGDGRNDFVVLRLDTECPDGAYQRSYYMDNEDSNNNNSNSGNIWPSSQANGSGWTDFALCFFPAHAGGVAGLPALPYVGIEYAVFMNPASGYGALNGLLRFDEEDGGNNSYTHSDNFPSHLWVDYATRFDKIIVQNYSSSRSIWYYARKTYP